MTEQQILHAIQIAALIVMLVLCVVYGRGE